MWDYRFYEASAQILPVLYLAILVEYGLLRQRWADRPPLFRAIFATAALWVGATFAVAEFQALDIVSRGEDPADDEPTGMLWWPADEEPTVILAAYLLAFGMLVLPLADRAKAAHEGLGSVPSNLINFGVPVAFFLLFGLVRLVA